MLFQKTEESHSPESKGFTSTSTRQVTEVPRETLRHCTAIHCTEGPGEDSELTGTSGA